MGDLSEHFSRHEFACRCGCGLDNIDQELIDGLEAVRKSVKVYYMIVKGLDGGSADNLSRIKIASGCRCVEYNASEKIKGSAQSAHLPDYQGICRAADPVAKDGEYNHAFLNGCFHSFERIGFGESRGVTKIHVDTAKDRPRPRLWPY